jgi:hypothetical protein
MSCMGSLEKEVLFLLKRLLRQSFTKLGRLPCHALGLLFSMASLFISISMFFQDFPALLHRVVIAMVRQVEQSSWMGFPVGFSNSTMRLRNCTRWLLLSGSLSVLIELELGEFFAFVQGLTFPPVVQGVHCKIMVFAERPKARSSCPSSSSTKPNGISFSSQTILWSAA